VQDVKQHLQVNGPWPYALSELYDTPEVTAAVQALRAAVTTPEEISQLAAWVYECRVVRFRPTQRTRTVRWQAAALSIMTCALFLLAEINLVVAAGRPRWQLGHHERTVTGGLWRPVAADNPGS